ncbi:MAG: hypothetical protein IJ202_08860 [Bacteroidales bacterium]|nr:hypothetical protein [Bacteroidales bacterium]MBQ9711572.1 hypothetical protein [Bacteroidales bacterium]
MPAANYIKIDNKGIEIKLDVIFYSEDGIIIAYAPALDLSGYGKDDAEARNSFEVALHEYIKYTVENKTLDDDLKVHGWTKEAGVIKAQDFSSLLANNKNLRDVVSHDFRKTSEKVAYPIFS